VTSVKRNILTGVYVFVLSIASGYVVVDGAAAEPYMLFRHSDAFVQIGLAFGLMVLWLQFAGYLFWGVMTRRVPKPWLALIILIAFAMFYLWQSPGSYAEDITKFVIEKR
jgi:hypothetical protein